MTSFAAAELLSAADNRPARDARPVVERNGTLVLAFDGRLDNRSELLATLGNRAGLEDPQVGDAGLVMAAYQLWGVAAPVYLLGDFAFVIYDLPSRRLFAARDAMGMRPLYYRTEPRRTVFASEIAQLLTLPDIPSGIHQPALLAHLTGVPGMPEWTMYRGINQLPPGHAAVIEPDRHKVWRFWTAEPHSEIADLDELDFVRKLSELLAEAVRCRMRGARSVATVARGDRFSQVGTAAAAAANGNGGFRAKALRTYVWVHDGDSGIPTPRPADPDRHRLQLEYITAPQSCGLEDLVAHGPDRDDPIMTPSLPVLAQTLARASTDGVSLLLADGRAEALFGGSRNGGSGNTRVDRVRSQLRRVIRLPWSSRYSHSLPRWISHEAMVRMGLEDWPTALTDRRQERYDRIFGSLSAQSAVCQERLHARYGLAMADPWSDRRLATFVAAAPPALVERVGVPIDLVRGAPQLPQHAPATPAVSREVVQLLISKPRSVDLGLVASVPLRRACAGALQNGGVGADLWRVLTLELWLRKYW